MRAALATEPLVETRPDQSGTPAYLATLAQKTWAREPLSSRLAVLKRTRHLLASRTEALCAAISPELARTPADTRAAEVLPLLEACRFLERNAAKILATRTLGRRGLPVWLAGVDSRVERVPFGQLLVIGPANYPLFLPGAQVLQALAAGNAVVWKPGRGGRGVAQIVAATLAEAGLPAELLTVTEDTSEAGREALRGTVTGVRPDKVIFTGSAAVGQAILHELADTATPSVMELSGSDAVVVLPSADVERVVRAMVFGLRLNGSATCMAPRRLVLVGATRVQRDALVQGLIDALAQVRAVELPGSTRRQLDILFADAWESGASLWSDGLPLPAGTKCAAVLKPVLLTGAGPAVRLACEDVFAPVLSVIEVEDIDALVAQEDACAYALTISIFGQEHEARALVSRLTAGTVLVNDVIVPTADARVPFGGRRGSGFGATRGAEGLLEMTAPKTVAVRRGRSLRHYDEAGPKHAALFDGLIEAAHAQSLKRRWRGLQRLIAAARSMTK